MKEQNINWFIKKMIVKVIFFATMLFIIMALILPVGVVVTDSIALGQMQNSDEMYILMETYNKVRSIVSVAFTGVIILFTYTLGRDIYKFVKTIKTETKKEN